MRRRDFLKAPAVTLLVPAAAGLSLQDAFAFGDEQKSPTREEAARQHPQRLHQDFSTYQPGIEYFFLGNGDIQAAIQYAPDRSGDFPPTFLGLTLMDAERFSRKWSTYLFHPERGYEGSKLYVMTGNRTYVVTPESFGDVRWKLVDAVPVVSLTWKAGTLNVEEEFYVPAEGAYLVRQVRIHNSGPAPASVVLRLPLVPNFTVFDDIGTDAGTNTAFGRGYTEVTLRCLDGAAKASGRYDVSTTLAPLAQEESTLARFVYTIRKGTPPLEAKDVAGMWSGTTAYWKSKPVLTTGDERLDRMYMLARSGLKALLARSGKRDGGIWQYNMEWVRDDVMMIQALCMAGMQDEARTLLEKNLSRCIAPDGCLVESSRWSGYDYTELDQNGQLVYGIARALDQLEPCTEARLVRRHRRHVIAQGGTGRLVVRQQEQRDSDETLPPPTTAESTRTKLHDCADGHRGSQHGKVFHFAVSHDDPQQGLVVRISKSELPEQDHGASSSKVVHVHESVAFEQGLRVAATDLFELRSVDL